MDVLEIRILGTFNVRIEKRRLEIASRPAQSLLAYLLLNPSKKHRREQLAGLLWPDANESNARTYLRQNLWMLRKELGKDFFDADKINLSIADSAEYWLDVGALLALVPKGASTEELLQALEHYKGDLLPGFYDDWVVTERERIRLIYDQNMRRLLEDLAEQRRWEEVISWSERSIPLSPAPELAFQALMRAHAALGDSSSVSSVYQRCVQILDRDLNVSPSAETQELYARLTGNEWAAPTRSPYRGLFAFREEDAPYFFGREFFVSRLTDLLEKKSLVAVSGSSGVGKSSTLFAGLIPAVKTNHGPLIVTMRPGNQPFAALQTAIHEAYGERHQTKPNGGPASAPEIAALIKAHEKTIWIVVDQFEELFTLCPDANTRTRFIDLVLQLAGPNHGRENSKPHVILGLRADFLSHLLDYRPAADALEDAILVLGPMINEEKRRAIQIPAEKAGSSFEVGLVERIVDDIGEEASNLPLMEFALTELWERRANRTLTHKDYESIGKVEGALTSYAEKVFAGLTLKEQEQVRQVFIQLVQPGQQTADTKRFATRQEYGPDVWPLILRLADLRLLVIGKNPNGEETVEVVHETLISTWDRLRYWMETDRQFRNWQEQLRVQVAQWERSQRDDSALLRGFALSEAQNWINERSESISEAERNYIERGLALQKKSVEERTRSQRRIRTGLAGGLVLALTLALVAGLSLQKSVEAERDAREAYSLSLAANADQLFSQNDYVGALALALQASSIEEPPLAVQEVLGRVAFAPGPRRVYSIPEILGDESVIPASLALSPDGNRVLVSARLDGRLSLIDLERGELLREFEGHSQLSNELAFSPDGTRAISGADDGRVFLWDVESGEIVYELVGHTGLIATVAIGPDGNRALSGGVQGAETIIEGLQLPGELILWDLETGREIQRFTGGHDQLVLDAVFGPEGSVILSSSGLRKASSFVTAYSSVILWDADTGEILSTFEDFEIEHPVGVAISPDGESILVGSMDRNLYLLDRETGDVLHVFGTHRDWVSDVAFSRDGRLAIAGLGDGTAVVWNLLSQNQVAELRLHSGEMTDFALAADGNSMVSISRDGSMVVWDLGNALQAGRLQLSNSPISDLALMPDGGHILAGSVDGSLRLVNWEEWAVERTMRVDGEIIALDINPEGDQALTGLANGRLILWDLENSRVIRELKGHQSAVNAVVFSPRQGIAYSASDDMSIIQWDISTGEVTGYLNGHVLAINSLAISSDGFTLVSGGTDAVILWDLELMEQIHSSFGLQSSISSVAFTPDQAEILVSSSLFGTYLSIWDSATREQMLQLEEENAILDIAVSPNGRLAAYAVGNGSVVLVDLEEGERIMRYLGHDDDGINTVAFSPDSQRVLSAGDDGTIIEWSVPDTSLSSLLSWIDSNRFIRELTCLEKAVYQIEPLCSVSLTSSRHNIEGGLEVPERAERVALAGENRGEIISGDLDIWLWEGEAGEVLSIFMRADHPQDRLQSFEEAVALGLLDPALVVTAPDGSLLAANYTESDPDNLTRNAAIRELELPMDGTYRIEARSFGGWTSGPYSLIIETSSAQSTE